ncbi:MAG TPA: cellulase family glycosylhydrolase [Candidatus Saccharimonadales bacterium]|nr:cellulase family glycosylhydrolase [Candidatus Saccharimonadales bacterium]
MCQPLTASAQSTENTKGNLQVVNNKVMAPGGKLFIPEGISIYGGLEDKDYTKNLSSVDAQIIAAVKYWHANTIRLQVAESNLFSNLSGGETFNHQFLNELIREVKLARSLHAAVVINDQTEFTNKTPAPTNLTTQFWQVVSRTFTNRPYIIFDLFNEPRLVNLTNPRPFTYTRFSKFLLPLKSERPFLINRASSAKQKIWTIWKYGGWVRGTNYVGMQSLVQHVRQTGANNLIWAEGTSWSQRLPAGKFLLSGRNIEYSYHHINLNDIKDWSFIGRLAKSRPVVDGEWSQYQSPWQECYYRAPVNVPHYLAYLKTLHIGLIAWSLQPGSLLKGRPNIIPSNTTKNTSTDKASQLRSPSTFSKDYLCNDEFGHGAGKLIMNYFQANASPLT